MFSCKKNKKAGCKVLKFLEPESVLSEQGCGDTGTAAGWTAGLQEDSVDGLALSDGKDLGGPKNKGPAHIGTAFCYHPGPARKDVLAIAADNIGRFPRGRETAELFRADRDPGGVLQLPEACFVGLYPAVIARAESDKAGTDKVEGARLILHYQR